MIRFEVGKTYSCRSICDHDCIFSFSVLSRSERTVTILVHAKARRRKIFEFDGSEAINPLGVYSMSPILTAKREG